MCPNEKQGDAIPKYRAPEPFDMPDRRWPSRQLTESPLWCSVDLRDGNQALPNPLNPEQKMEYFKLLCDIGFRHIEVAFPSASNDDFDFVRRLIEGGYIPDEVFIMGLTQCRPHLIERTFESMEGVSRGIVHAYVATSDLHMRQVFGLTREETLKMAVTATRQIRELAEAAGEGSDLRYQFSPEEFTDTDLGFALEICEAVFAEWGRATPEKPLILNLPATVERRPPNHYADMIELFCKRFSARDSVVVSVHSHNDQGMAVASTELTLLAGADRVEGTLFGHGERTGNVDIITVANNLRSRGIDPGLDFSDLPHIVETVERLTNMPVHYRQPYAGEYVFTAFSGSHQDAIRKGLRRKDLAPDRFGMKWKVPYLHIDPTELGRKFERLIRINSQSGKGGVAWVLEHEFGLELPKAMHPEVREVVQQYCDTVGREVSGQEVYELFVREFVDVPGPWELLGYWPRPDETDPTNIHGEVKVRLNGQEESASADGNGPISAFVQCLHKVGASGFAIDDYDEQAVGKGADAVAMAYVPLKLSDDGLLFGVGTDTNIDQAAVRAVIAGLNRMARQTETAD